MATNNCTQTPLQLDKESPQLPKPLPVIPSREGFDELDSNLPDDKSATVIDRLGNDLDNPDPTNNGPKEDIRKLQHIRPSRILLPSSHVLSSDALNTDEHAFSSGGFSDVHKGTFKGQKVCVKRLRATLVSSSEEAIKMFFREAFLWKRLIHPNIVPFRGMTVDPLQIASEWMPNGELTTYIKSNPHANRVDLLVGVANGLDYLHSCDIIHGDLKGPNILMDGSGHARITDFGLAQDTTGVVSISGAHSSRWTAPEVLNGGTPSTKADVFSFAMVMVEVFTGTVPFNQYTSLVAVVAIIQEERPPWPTHPTFTEELRELMKRCWNQDQCKRPQTSEVLQTLNSLMPRSAEPGCSDQPLLHERTHPGEPLPVTADVQIPVPDIQQQLEKSDPSNEEYRPLLDVLLSRQDLDPHIQNLQGSDLQSFVELLDKALIHIPPTDDLFRKTLCRLQSTCSNREVLPLSCVIPNGGLSNRGEAIASGSFTDVYQAELDGKKVCVKTCKLCDQDAMSITKKTLYGEVVVWKRLQHPNIVPFLGVSTRIEPTLEIVYDWMENGRIAEYVERNPGVDRINLVYDVANGLRYLHSSNVIHGNLEDVNILVDKDGHACLTDFGLTSIVWGDDSTRSPQDSDPADTTTWAPKILKGGSVSKEGDVLAFAVVANEILKEYAPPDTNVSPRGHNQGTCEPLHNELWGFTRRCLKREPGERPTTDQLLEFFRNFRFSREGTTPEAQTLPSSSPRETVDGYGTNANNLDSTSDRGGTLQESTIQSSANSTKGGNNGPATHGTGFESKGVTDNTPHTGQPSQPKDFDAATPSVDCRNTAEMARGAEDAYVVLPGNGPDIPKTSATTTTCTTSAKTSLMRIADWDGKSQDIYQVLTTAFEAKDYLDCIKDLRAQNIDPPSYINSLDKIIDSLPAEAEPRNRCVRGLRKTCGLYEVLPTSYAVTCTLSKTGSRTFASGRFVDVWRLANEDNHVFAAKSFRVCEQDPVDKINKKYCKAVVILKRANHPNILSIEGVAPGLFEFCMVSQWMPNGGLLGYVTKYPGVNRLELLIGVTHGLYYLHGNKIVHGDLKSSNILIDANGSPRLSDFGLCSIMKNIDPVNASTPSHGYTARYCAPELLDVDEVVRVEKKKPTNKSDVYSLSMVIVELVTGKIPFPDSSDPRVIIMISKGKRPSKPLQFDAPGMTPAVWKIAKKCWREKAEERLEVKDVLQYLENPPNHDGKLSQALRSTAAKGSSQLSAIHQKAIRFLPSNPKT